MEPINVDIEDQSENREMQTDEHNGNEGGNESKKEKNGYEKAVDEKGHARARRSIVWDHFTYVKGIKNEKCPYCKVVIACESKANGTSGLKSHLEYYCPTSPVLIKKKGDKKQSTIGFKPIGKGEGSSLASHSFSVEKCKRALARLYIKDNRPFSIVDDERFKEYTWELNPMFKIPSRWDNAKL